METIAFFTKQGRRLPCFCFDGVVSTNDEAKRIIREGGPKCFAVTATEQTGGRGRHGRAFLSLAERGLYLSFVCPVTTENCASFGVLSALAVAELLREFFGLDVTFKWPNDVMADGKKICGILPESVVGKDGERYVVSGMGVNFFYSAEELGALSDIATSAVLCCKNEQLKCRFEQDRSGALRAAAVRLAELAAEIADETESGENLVAEYAARLDTLGKKVRYTGADGRRRTGVATGVAPDCALIVKRLGKEERIAWGEVTTVVRNGRKRRLT